MYLLEKTKYFVQKLRKMVQSLKLCSPREENVEIKRIKKIKRINLIIIEKDDEMFDRLRQDIKEYSPYVNKIYRSSYHGDIYKINEWYKCKFIIAHNPENAGLDFFRSLYRNPIAKENQIFGLIYTRGHEHEFNFYKIMRNLYERSQHLFLGLIYKRFGSIEKILDVIRNIAINCCCYPIIDWLQGDTQPAIVNPNKLDLLRKLHNLKHQISDNLQPLIIILTEFHENKNDKTLKKNLKNNKAYLNKIEEIPQRAKELLREFLQFKYKDTILDGDETKTETSFYVKQLKEFVNLDEMNLQNNLNQYINIFKKKLKINILSQLINRNNNGSLEGFLKEYDNFIKSLNKLVNLLDEYYFLV